VLPTKQSWDLNAVSPLQRSFEAHRLCQGQRFTPFLYYSRLFRTIYAFLCRFQPWTNHDLRLVTEKKLKTSFPKNKTYPHIVQEEKAPAEPQRISFETFDSVVDNFG
jgi:hypothetical protein